MIFGAGIMAFLRSLAGVGCPSADLLSMGNRAVDAVSRAPIRRLLGWLGSTRLGASSRQGGVIERRLALAGGPVPPEVVSGAKLALAIGAAAVALASGLVLPVAAMLSPVIALASYRIPDVVLARAARRRQRRIDAHVPDFVEMLLVMTEAGLSPVVAFRRSAATLA